MQEMAAWDTHIKESIADKALEILRRAEHNLGFGFIFNYDYSGADFPKESLRVALPAVFGEDRFTIMFPRVCDWGEVQRQVLYSPSHDLEDGQSCVFGDLHNCLHPAARQWLEQVAPTNNSPKDAAVELNDRIVEFLDKNRWVYSQDATAYCHVHKRECPAYPKYVFMHRDLYMPDARPAVTAVSPSQSAIFDQSRCSNNLGSDGWSHGCRLLKRQISTCSRGCQHRGTQN